jgi:hypothetical protein
MAVRMPDQQLREVRAFRKAVATTMPDTATVRSGDKDWLKGDTIYAYFDSTGRRKAVRAAPDHAAASAAAPVVPPKKGSKPKPADTVATAPLVVPRDTTARDTTAADTSTTKPQLRELKSMGHASARYQLAAQGSPPEKPAINYSRGDRITVTMDTVGVSKVQIDDHAVGVYLEPVRDTSAIPAANEKIPDANAGPPVTGAPVVPATPAPRAAAKPAAIVPRTTPARP